MTETTQLPLAIEPQELVYEDRNQRIQRVVARFQGFNKEYFVSDHGVRAALLAVHNGEVLLVRQYRLLINGIAHEVPGGRVDEGETPEMAAARECFEETGVRCANLKPLITYHPSLDIWKNQTKIFLSEDVEKLPANGQRVWVPLPRCIEMVFGGEIADSLSIIAVFTYQTLLGMR